MPAQLVCGKLVIVGTPINFEERIGKWVGRRSFVDPAKTAAGLQRLVNQIMRSQRRGICPKGVFRFRTHQEANEWLLKMMARQAARS